MQFALLMFEFPEGFVTRNHDKTDPYIGAWRAYYKALVEAGIYLGGNPLKAPETATTCDLRKESGAYRTAPSPTPKEQLGGFIILELPSRPLRCSFGAGFTAVRSAVNRRGGTPSRRGIEARSFRPGFNLKPRFSRHTLSGRAAAGPSGLRSCCSTNS
jgi:hypothetical protein